ARGLDFAVVLPRDLAAARGLAAFGLATAFFAFGLALAIAGLRGERFSAAGALFGLWFDRNICCTQRPCQGADGDRQQAQTARVQTNLDGLLGIAFVLQI